MENSSSDSILFLGRDTEEANAARSGPDVEVEVVESDTMEMGDGGSGSEEMEIEIGLRESDESL